MKWQEVAGWYGAAALLVAYAGVSFGYLAAGGVLFQLLNATGALGIVIVSLSKQNYPPAVLNAVWLVVGLVALVRILL
jgi:hypothetical protein